MKAPYLFDEHCKVWIKKDYQSRIVYSDGDEVEQRIFRSVANSRDVSCLSEELESAITDWTSLCFLSKKRSNLLRPFQHHFKNKRILEVGCGAGPICRFLGESGAQVYGLEPNIQRARIAAERCRDLPNVNIFCDDIAGFDIDEQFDGIVMVGVLEYATKYSNKEQPALDFLQHLKKFIKQDTGFIITAIENQLGLKYFSGFAEDHAGVFMHGINNNYQYGEANTWGRKSLIELFQQAGFPHNDFYLPFPDYKLPSLVFYPGSSQKIEDTDFNIDSILSNISYTDIQQKVPLFSLDKALPLVAKNGLLEELSNSFCVFSSFNQPVTTEDNTLFALYNTARKKAYCKETIFTKQGGSVILTRKYLDNKIERPLDNSMITFPEEETAYSGTIYYYELVKIVNRPGWSVELVADWLKIWFGFIKKELVASKQYKEEDYSDSRLLIDARYIDAVPINVIVHQGIHHFIDLEVDCKENIETGYLIFRAVFSSVSRLSSIAMPGDLQYAAFDTLLKYLFTALGYSLSDELLDTYYEKEALLVNAVSPAALKTVKGSITRLGIRPSLQTLLMDPAELLQLQQQHEQLKATILLQEQQSAAFEAKIAEQEAVINQLAEALNNHGH